MRSHSRLQRVRVSRCATALVEPSLDRGAEMDAAVKARDPRFVSRCSEAGELARRKPIAHVGGVLKGVIVTEELREDFGRRGRLSAVPAWIFREWRRDEDRGKGGIDVGPDIGDGPDEVELVF